MPNRPGLALLAVLLLLTGCSQAPAPAPTPPPQTPEVQASRAPARSLVSTVAFADARNGWVALELSGQAALFRTANGGQDWTRTGAPAFRLQALRFADAKRGAALGTSFGCQTKGQDCSLLIATTADAGATWETRYTHALSEGLSDNAPGLELRADGTGYAFYAGSLESLLLTTADGGAMWTPATVPDRGWTFQSAAFAGATLGWSLARECKVADQQERCRYAIFATRDGGQRWEPQFNLPDGRRMRPGNISVVDGQQVWVFPTALAAYCGMSGCTGPIYRTADGGKTWQEVLWSETRQTAEGGIGFPRSVHFVDASHGWMVVGSGAAGVGGIGVTSDGGKTWNRHVPPDVRDFRILSAPSADVAWAVSYKVRGAEVLLRTEDGGLTWTPVPIPAVQ